MEGLQVFAKMAEENNKALKLAPLGNVVNVRKGKGGWGRVEIVVDNKTIDNILENKLCGGFLVADKEEYDKTAKLNSK